MQSWTSSITLWIVEQEVRDYSLTLYRTLFLLGMTKDMLLGFRNVLSVTLDFPSTTL
jgi:hypothetical protein